jgi:hypothetical protein
MPLKSAGPARRLLSRRRLEIFIGASRRRLDGRAEGGNRRRERPAGNRCREPPRADAAAGVPGVIAGWSIDVLSWRKVNGELVAHTQACTA